MKVIELIQTVLAVYGLLIGIAGAVGMIVGLVWTAIDLAREDTEIVWGNRIKPAK